MTETQPAAEELLRRPTTQATQRRRWSWAHYLALIAVPILIVHTWTIVAWLADGPSEVTEFRDRNSLSWYAAKVFEGLAILVAIVVLIYLVRSCRRERRVLTFDVIFCLCGMTVFWADYGCNFFVPTFLESSNFVNLTNPCGHMPFVVNPDCGRAPDPILFNFLFESFGLLGLAIVVAAGFRRVRSRWPGLSTAKLFGLVLLAGFVIDLIFEPTLAVALHLWTYPAPSWMSLPLGDGFRYPILELAAAGLWFGLLVALRTFKDDRGLTLVERGLEHHQPRTRKAITLLAAYGAFQLISWGPGLTPLMAYGPYETQWPKMPAHVVNDVCDAPGIEGTRYGPCPGSPGFHMPGRHSLPGRSP